MRQRLLALVADVRRAELPFALLMAAQFFLVVTTFWILKPLKKALFIQLYDERPFVLGPWRFAAAEAELLAKVANMVVAIGAVALFTWLARRLRRERLVGALCGLFVLGFAAYALALRRPDAATVWSFYLFGDAFSTMLVPAFFAFLNDSVDTDAAKRLYGLVGTGGVAGGVFGSTTIGALVGRVQPPEWAWICLVLGVLVAALAAAAGRVRPAYDHPGEAGAAPAPERHPRSSAALEGAALVTRSPYLLSIAAIVALYEIVSTVMDFQFTSTVSHYLNGDAIAAQLSHVFALTNAASMAVQLFGTSLVMRRLGVGAALLVLPAAAGAGSLAFLAAPTLWAGSLLNTADNAFAYSINQSAKEALYVPTTPDEKYEAKAFVDMFVQRFAKAVAVGASLAMATWVGRFDDVRWLSAFTVTVIVAWVAAARYAGRRVAEAERAPLR